MPAKLEPISAAKTVFEESLNSLMAHTLRGVVNLFRKDHIELNVTIAADMFNVIRLKAPNTGATSVLLTHFVKGTKDNSHQTEPDKLSATIFIHKDANKHLARVCIAHEVYHLLLELDTFVRKGRKEWPVITGGKDIEDACNQFAWQLCKYHDAFNRKDALREKHILFPSGLFANALKLHDSAWYLEWPEGISLDPDNSFRKRLLAKNVIPG